MEYRMTISSKSTLFNSLKENQSIIIFILLMLVFRSAIADWNDVPTGSMQPTIVEGDRIFINKIAYDLRMPFSLHSLIKFADPKANDIIVFESKVAKKRLVKRVIGIPGDTVSMSNNKLLINGQALSYNELSQSKQQTILTEGSEHSSHKIRLNAINSNLANFSLVTVPDNHYLVLGDNRDNSADSRAIGFVPRAEIIGRSTKVVVSFDYNNYFLPRAERFLLTI
jgi:signal peptidase I